MIYLTGFESGTIADILLNTRLSSIPYGGQLTIQAQASANNATNTFSITIQLPDGSVPVDSQRVSAGNLTDDSSGGVLDSRKLDQWTFPANQGGHFIIAFTESGAAFVTWRVVLRP